MSSKKIKKEKKEKIIDNDYALGDFALGDIDPSTEDIIRTSEKVSNALITTLRNSLEKNLKNDEDFPHASIVSIIRMSSLILLHFSEAFEYELDDIVQRFNGDVVRMTKSLFREKQLKNKKLS